MAIFQINAHECKFDNTERGFRVMSYAPFDPKLYSARFEANRADELVAEQERVREVVKAFDPGVSFFVSAVKLAGNYPRGAKNLRALEYDAELVATVDEAVAELVAQRKLDPERANPVPNPTIAGARYEVVGLPGGPQTFGPDRVFGAFEARGFTHSGFSKSRALREELRGRPEFKGLCGPMWGGTDGNGTPIVRYETPAAYAALSA